MNKVPFIYNLVRAFSIVVEGGHLVANEYDGLGKRLWVHSGLEQLHTNVQCFGAQAGVEILGNVLNVGPHQLRLLQSHIQV